jgi:hypothetical protein
MLLFYAILGLGVQDSMQEPLTREVTSSKSIFIHVILGLGLGDSMHELHKGSDEFQIYVFYAILSLGWEIQCMSSTREVTSSKSMMLFMPFWV